MSTITRERLTSIVFGAKRHPGSFTKLELELAEHMLASLGAEPVAVITISHGGYDKGEKVINYFQSEIQYLPEGQMLYAAPSAPVSDSLMSELLVIAKKAAEEADECAHAEWNDDSMEHSAAISDWERRAAMLQGADVNSPVIPDGWVMLPVDLTGAMTNAMTDAILDDLHNVDVWRSVLAAAPQQGVKEKL